jgi:GTP-binding protein
MEDGRVLLGPTAGRVMPELLMPPISSKPWLVIATKADKEATQENFKALKEYLQKVEEGAAEHPSGKKNAWKRQLHAIPVSAINAAGVDGIPAVIVDLLDH